MANVYFLFIMVLQIVPPISITGGQPAILLPLLFVTSVSAIKDLFEDIKRHNADSQENGRKAEVLDPTSGQFQSKIWKDIKVGSIVRVTNNQFFPADMILLNSSGRKGICYIETKNLDGETNLKHKVSNKDVMVHVQNDKALASFKGQVKCEGPSDKIYQFDGVITVNGERISLSYENFLLRGSSLRQTDWIVGLITFTGHGTRIMKNSTGARTKFSRVEKQTNMQIIFIFGLQCVLCLVATVYGTFWKQTYTEQTEWYLALKGVKGNGGIFERYWILNAIQRYFTWILIFTNMVPISLMVTLEVVKFLQAFFIQWDYRIYDLEKDMPTKVQSSNLNEELGQVNYVFSDKTGTLTCNIMEFKKFSAGKFSYGNSIRKYYQ